MRDLPPLPVPEQPPAQPVKPNPLKKTKPKAQALVLKVVKMRALAMQRPGVSARALRFHIGAPIHPASVCRPYAPDESKSFPPQRGY